MSAGGVVTMVAKACCGDDLRDCWRVWFDLDDPHALMDTGAARPPHSWAVDLPRSNDIAPCAAGDRLAVSTHGRRDVTITDGAGKSVRIRSEPPGTYDPERRTN